MSLLEGTKQIFQRILGGSKVLIFFGRKCCLLQNSEKVSGNFHQMECYIVYVMQTDRSSPTIREKVEHSGNKRWFSKSTSSLHDKTRSP